jgi:beta-glucanase (GH16 family)
MLWARSPFCVIDGLKGNGMRRRAAAMILTLLSTLGLGIAAPGWSTARTSSPSVVPHGPGGHWRLVFDDEFNGSALNTRTWQTLFPWGACNIPSNHEQQCYVPSAIHEATGVVRLTATRTGGRHTPYASGLLSSYASFHPIYGFFEIRAHIPQGRGFWPAFWLAPEDMSWPPEIDVFEVGNSVHPTQVFLTNHYGTRQHARQVDTRVTIPHLFQGFHTFGLDWEPHAVTWYIDGVQRFRTTSNIPKKPMYLIANLAVGGGWSGQPDASTRFPSSFTIDYIRAFKHA